MPANSILVAGKPFNEEFEAAKDLAFAYGQMFYEKRLAVKTSGQKLEGINAKDIDTSCLIFALKTRFHKTYGERQKIEQTVTPGGNVKSFELSYKLESEGDDE